MALSPEDRKLIHDVSVMDGVRFTGAAGFIRTRILTYYVGTSGPFTAVLDLIDYTPQKIEDVYAQEIASLRAAGAKLEGGA